MSKYTTEQFHGNAAEASTLGWPVGSIPDSFFIGQHAYRYVKEERDGEGEVMGWRYRRVGSQESVMVFND